MVEMLDVLMGPASRPRLITRGTVPNVESCRSARWLGRPVRRAGWAHVAGDEYERLPYGAPRWSSVSIAPRATARAS
jgi:hypothetical protein